MFCQNSPVWPFLQAVGAVQDPESARVAMDGTYLIEVFPALALPSLEPSFATRMGAPKYNPRNRKQYKPADWRSVTEAVAKKAKGLVYLKLEDWCLGAGESSNLKKADQDRLDAGICLAAALRWRLRPREDSIMIGGLVTGYMFTPDSTAMRERLTAAAAKMGDVPVDGISAAAQSIDMIIG